MSASGLVSCSPQSATPAKHARIELFGVQLDNVSMSDVLDGIAESIKRGEFCYAVTPNVDHVMKLQYDKSLQRIYQRARFVVADGVPLLWASAILGTPLRERVNGTDLFERLCEMAADRGYSVFFLGGNPGAAEGAATALKRAYPALKVAGWHCPTYGFERSPVACDEIRIRIASTQPDILFVALGCPKQEQWIFTHGHRSGAKFAVGIGISFSLLSGQVRRAPKFFQRHGMEWFWRLATEPKRLWRRYLVDDIPFVSLVARAWVEQIFSRRQQSGQNGIG